MKFSELLGIVADSPVFSSAILRVGDVDPVDIGSQLSRWVKAGRLAQLRRGIYVVEQPYRTRDPHPFEIANLLSAPSYVSLEAALAFHGLIPEAVFVTTSVTTARPVEFDTPVGRYAYRRIDPRLFWGYAEYVVNPGVGQRALVAHPEKALLDLVYLRPGGDAPVFLRQLRIEMDGLDPNRLTEYAARMGRPKLSRAVRNLVPLAAEQSEGWVTR
ncbi:MAG: hypothetical protein U1E29_12860 [Coriobacteriia bacterium]|nr:hypothetical protein [Coriobacteriia bacterium]